MTDTFKNKYRIPTARLKNWDYSSEGTYFITICTRGRECFFGNVVMPNHVHGIIIINKTVELHATSLQPSNAIHLTTSHTKNEFMSHISPNPNSLSTIVRSYKSAVTK